MIFRKLGRTGMEASALGLGCYQLTGKFAIDPEVADGILDYAMESEINLFDAAWGYNYGEAESVVGAARRRHPGKKAVFTSKIGFFLKTVEQGMVKVHLEVDEEAYTNPMEIKRAIKRTLWELQMDHLDILMVHEHEWPTWKMNYETGDAPITTALENLKKEGIISAIGTGTWDMHSAAQLVRTGRFDVVLAAGGMNLLSRPICDELIPACKEKNVGLILGGGFGQNNPFLIVKDRVKLDKHKDNKNPRVHIMRDKLYKLYDIAGELDISMTELAIRFILSFEEIASHVPGAREIAHVKANLAAAEKGPLDKSYVDRILAIQDGNGGQFNNNEMYAVTQELLEGWNMHQ